MTAQNILTYPTIATSKEYIKLYTQNYYFRTTQPKEKETNVHNILLAQAIYSLSNTHWKIPDTIEEQKNLTNLKTWILDITGTIEETGPLQYLTKYQDKHLDPVLTIYIISHGATKSSEILNITMDLTTFDQNRMMDPYYIRMALEVVLKEDINNLSTEYLSILSRTPQQDPIIKKLSQDTLTKNKNPLRIPKGNISMTQTAIAGITICNAHYGCYRCIIDPNTYPIHEHQQKQICVSTLPNMELNNWVINPDFTNINLR